MPLTKSRNRWAVHLMATRDACANDPGSPTIDVYRVAEASTLYVRRIGNPALWLNVIGNVSGVDGLDSVTYSFNDGLAQVWLAAATSEITATSSDKVAADNLRGPLGVGKRWQ
jgi:hypothetical protein